MGEAPEADQPILTRIAAVKAEFEVLTSVLDSALIILGLMKRYCPLVVGADVFCVSVSSLWCTV